MCPDAGRGHGPDSMLMKITSEETHAMCQVTTLDSVRDISFCRVHRDVMETDIEQEGCVIPG